MSGYSHDHLRKVQKGSFLRNRGALGSSCFALKHERKRRDISTASVGENEVLGYNRKLLELVLALHLFLFIGGIMAIP